MNIAVTLGSVRGESAGTPKLVVNLQAKNKSDANLGIIHIDAEIRVAPSMIEDDISKSCLLGYGLLEYQIGQLPKGMEQPWTVAVALHPPVLNKMEQVRNGGDLILRVLFFCTAAYMADGVSPLTGLARASVHAPDNSSSYCTFKIAQSDWEKTLKELGDSELTDSEEVIKRASKRAQETLREIEGISAKAKEAASIVGVAQHASYFMDEVADHRRVSFLWLISTAFFGAAAAGYSLWSFHLGTIFSAEGSVAWWPHVTYLTSRLIVLSVIFFGIGWSAKNYRAHKHNEIVNRHRQNALRTFETFAVATSDAATKDAVLLAATKSIFEAQSSGYLAGEYEKVPSGTVIEVLKKAISTREPS